MLRLILFILLLAFSFNSLPVYARSKEPNLELSELLDSARESNTLKKPKKTLKACESIKALYPLTSEAKESMMILIEVHMKEANFPEALIELQELSEHYPLNTAERQDLFLKRAYSYYGLMEQTPRDRAALLRAEEAIDLYLKHYSADTYYDQLQEMMLKVENRIIFSEIEVANFYERKHDFVAALVRYKSIYEGKRAGGYQSELLYRIITCLWHIGLNDESYFYKKLLQENFANSVWANDATRYS